MVTLVTTPIRISLLRRHVVVVAVAVMMFSPAWRAERPALWGSIVGIVGIAGLFFGADTKYIERAVAGRG